MNVFLFNLKTNQKAGFFHQPAVIAKIFHLQSKKEPGKMNFTLMRIIFKITKILHINYKT